MRIAKVWSIKKIEKQYGTGEEPVLVVCSDYNQYVCKYMRSSASAFKLVCELAGIQLAMAWDLPSPFAAFVFIKHEHWPLLGSLNVSAPAFGSRKIESVIDINPTTSLEIPRTEKLQRQIMKIALFDIWMANEDRNWNNANLLYDISKGDLVVIDHGCVFNTATFDYPLCQLTTTDTILCSDLSRNQLVSLPYNILWKYAEELKDDFMICLKRSRNVIGSIVDSIPPEWNVPLNAIEGKLLQLFDAEWIEKCWSNFIENLNDNRDE